MLHRILAAGALAIAATLAHAANPQVELDTSAGVIKLELFPDAAPKTVANFLEYVKSGHYAGTQFHRVIDGFMIQAGGYTADFKEKPTRPPIAIESEASKKAGLSNVPGTIAMARTGDPNSATAQFFINVANNTRLDFSAATQSGYGYTVFGKVVDGMDVVNKIAKGPKGATGSLPPGINPADVPSTQVIIKSAKVIGG
jgi:peptidyl-prolyl cis-trans isomerase A (cyclophilin A)/peptidyl-prolyl cis-trans isomerase B (cyclophilin B)